MIIKGKEHVFQRAQNKNVGYVHGCIQWTSTFWQPDPHREDEHGTPRKWENRGALELSG
jgi:hypothetical protein